jgi:hypothetical protein
MAIRKQKIATRIWTPLLEKFMQRMDAACLRRDAYLAKVLQGELHELDGEITEPNSDAAHTFIVAHLDKLPRKLVTLTLPEDLVRKLDDICERKRIVRDSFFNRLFFLLAGDWRVRERLFFPGDKWWFQRVLEKSDFSSTTAGDRLDPIPAVDDPFEAIRLGICLLQEEEEEELEKELDIRESKRPRHQSGGIYTTVLDDSTFPMVDLYGLNTYLPDRLVPGITEHRRFETLFDDLLAPEDKQPAQETQP